MNENSIVPVLEKSLTVYPMLCIEANIFEAWFNETNIQKKYPPVSDLPLASNIGLVLLAIYRYTFQSKWGSVARLFLENTFLQRMS